MTDDPKPTITPEEMQRRRVHVRVAIADDRIEGIDGPGTDEQAVLDAYIRGEIEARDLVTAYRRARGEAMTETDADPIRAYPELVTAIAIRAFSYESPPRSWRYGRSWLRRHMAPASCWRRSISASAARSNRTSATAPLPS